MGQAEAALPWPAGAGVGASAGALQPLLAPLAAAWLVYVAIAILLYSPALRVFDAGWLPYAPTLRSAAFTLVPDALLHAARHTAAGAFVLALYGVLVCLAVAAWCRAVQVARRIDDTRLAPILALTAALATCPLLFVGLSSNDVYLYHAYGRILDAYATNPLLATPAAFPGDPVFPWVYWKDLPSAYGPVWVMLSGLTSWVAGESVTAGVIAYRGLALLLHLATAAAIWMVLRRIAPREAAAGTIFYAWNPLVLIEVVANAHNDALVALFAVLVVAAGVTRAWSWAAFFTGCAVMVKPFAGLLAAPVAIRMLRTVPPADRMWTFGLAAAAGAATLVALSLPLWAGTALLRNITLNPASHMYTNTLWELGSRVGHVIGVETTRIQHPYLDWARWLCFAAGAAWILTRRWPRRGIAGMALPLWILFCLTASWVWPWYFVPAIALAPLARRGGMALAAALTIGGLLFWITWPPHPEHESWLHTLRPLVLFGPVLLALASRRVRGLLLGALGLQPLLRRGPAPVIDRVRPLRPGYRT